MTKPAMHYVCSLDEARRLVSRQDRLWVSNCGCREERRGCRKSRIDLCLMFRGDIQPSGSGMHEITRGEVELIFAEAKARGLVTRPFRDEKTRTETEGICFCCDCCCGYFRNKDEVCDKGDLVESTDRDLCNDCGDCVEVCHFGARLMREDRLAVLHGNCYGCGLCVGACPENAVEITSAF